MGSAAITFPLMVSLRATPPVPFQLSPLDRTYERLAQALDFHLCVEEVVPVPGGARAWAWKGPDV